MVGAINRHDTQNLRQIVQQILNSRIVDRPTHQLNVVLKSSTRNGSQRVRRHVGATVCHFHGAKSQQVPLPSVDVVKRQQALKLAVQLVK